MVIERARAWRLLGMLPLPGIGELATPVKGVVGGCGYVGCPRPGHLHNGVDFLAPQGTPIHAADIGTVALLESPARTTDTTGGAAPGSTSPPPQPIEPPPAPAPAPAPPPTPAPAPAPPPDSGGASPR